MAPRNINSKTVTLFSSARNTGFTQTFTVKFSLLLLLLFGFSGSLSAQNGPVGDFIDSFARQHDFHGTVLVEKKGKTVFEGSFGLANLPFKATNTVGTKYKIASITKLFTAVLVMQLVEAGKLDLQKTIKDYLPHYKGEGGDRVTVHTLLNHSSGMANLDTVKSVESALLNGLPVYQKPYTPDQLLDKFCSQPLVNEPGKVFDYNNADYIVLGKIIESLYGQTYEEVLKERILLPFNMVNTGMFRQEYLMDSLADTYFFRSDINKLVPDLPVYIENWYAAGAMYSTVHDLLLFSHALFGHRLINKTSLDLLVKPGLDSYGYGLWSYESTLDGKSYRVVKRPGQIMGAQSMFFHFLDEDMTVIILSNVGNLSLDDFVFEISKRMVLDPTRSN